MKTASAEMISHLAGEVTSLATCWKITRTDGEIFRFTDHDRDLTVSGDVYESALGYSRTAIQSRAGTGVDNLDVEGILDTDSLDELELRAGLFDYSEFEIFSVNWQDLSQGIIRLRRGNFGEITLRDNGVFSTELRGMTQPLSQQIIQLYSNECRADLGDSKCGVNIASLTTSGEVTSVTNRFSFQVDIPSPGGSAGYYAGGVITWTSGANSGKSTEIKRHNVSPLNIRLHLPAVFEIQVGDTFTISPGCNKHATTCRNKFDNFLNFRGEPLLPGPDSITRVSPALKEVKPERKQGQGDGGSNRPGVYEPGN